MADRTLCQHPAIAAVQAVRRLVDAGDLVTAVGEKHVEALLREVANAEAALSTTIPELSSSPDVQQQQEQALKRRIVQQKQVNSLYDLARECLSLIGACDVDYTMAGTESNHVPPHRENLDLEWMFGVNVAEVAAHGLGAVATGLSFSVQSSVLDNWAVDVLERLSLDFDYFALFIFGGLTRLSSRNRDLQPNEKRLFRALCGSCVWALWAIGHGIGYHNFTGKVLWEWACEDAIWATTLAKGVLSISFEDLADMQLHGTDRDDALLVLPADLQELQHAVLGALLSLPHPHVVFSVGSENNDVSISARNADLAGHKADLAAAVVRCKLFDELIDVCSERYAGSGATLVSYLVALLQPELTEDQVEADVLSVFSSEACRIVDLARTCSMELVAYLYHYTDRIWQLLASTVSALGTEMPSGFLQDCADFAFFLPPTASILNNLIDQYLATFDDVVTLAALCVLSANANIAPEGGAVGYASERLVRGLMSVPADLRTLALERWARWRGPVRLSFLGQWAGMLQCAEILQAETLQQQQERHLQVDPQASVQTDTSQKIGGLRNVIEGAPADFRCALDGQVMLDPVISPQGILFERMVIANALTSNSFGPGRCPVSGEPLTLQDCRRLPELRVRIGKWVRERSSVGRKHRQLAVAVGGGIV